MAATLEVIKLRDVLRVTSIPRLVPGVPVATVELRGEDFNSAEVVAINDVPSPEFVVINKNTIFAQLPDNVRRVRTVSVISSRFTTTENASKLIFQVGDKTRSVEGVLKLVQLFTKWLLTTPGSDIFDPSTGGGLQDLVGQITSTHRTEKTLSAIARAVSTTASQIKRAQLSTPGLPLNERLLAATLLDVRMAKGTDEARARVQIDNVAGITGVAAVEL